jgi:hypothetical protein
MAMPGRREFSYRRVTILPSARVMSALAQPERCMNHMTPVINAVPTMPAAITIKGNMCAASLCVDPEDTLVGAGA